MPHRFRKVQRGQRFDMPADAYNAFVDAAEAHQLQREAISARRGGILTPPPEGKPITVLVRNDSGVDLPRFGVLGIEAPIIEPGPAEDGYNTSEFSGGRPAVIGQAITEEDQYPGAFVIAREPIAAGKIGNAVIRGVTAALITVLDETHTHADTAPGSPYLESGFTGGARILWRQEEDEASGGGNERWALLEIGPRVRDRFPVRLGEAQLLSQQTFLWFYKWEARLFNNLSGDPAFGRYLIPPGEPFSDEGIEERMAFNRLEAASAEDPAGLMVPPLAPGTIVELRAERTYLGFTRFVFDAPPRTEFDAIVTGRAVQGWPEQYTWKMGRLAGEAYQEDPTMPDWSLLGPALVRVETSPGFGTEYGPYGVELEDDLIEAQVIPIPNGTPVRITIVRDTAPGSASSRPMITAVNGLTVACKNPPGGVTRLSGPRRNARASLPGAGGCGGCG